MTENNEKINETEEVKEEETIAPEEKKKKTKKSDKLLEEKEAQIDELNNKYLRLAAEYDNFRRRSAKEREGIFADAYASAMSAIMPVIDNLERAAMYNDAEKVRALLNEINSFKKGTVIAAINGHWHANAHDIKDDILFFNINSAKNGKIRTENFLRGKIKGGVIVFYQQLIITDEILYSHQSAVIANVNIGFDG